MMVFFWSVAVLRGGGSGRLFLVPFCDEGRKGGVGYHTFIRLLLRFVLFYVLDTRCQIRLPIQTLHTYSYSWRARATEDMVGLGLHFDCFAQLIIRKLRKERCGSVHRFGLVPGSVGGWRESFVKIFICALKV